MHLHRYPALILSSHAPYDSSRMRFLWNRCSCIVVAVVVVTKPSVPNPNPSTARPDAANICTARTHGARVILRALHSPTQGMQTRVIDCELEPGLATPAACAALLRHCGGHLQLQPNHPDEQLLQPVPPCLDHLQVLLT